MDAIRILVLLHMRQKLSHGFSQLKWHLKGMGYLSNTLMNLVRAFGDRVEPMLQSFVLIPLTSIPRGLPQAH